VSSQRYRIFEALQGNREKRGSFVSINCSLFRSPKDEWRWPQSQPAENIYPLHRPIGRGHLFAKYAGRAQFASRRFAQSNGFFAELQP
jgi:hypothetical protein